LYEIIISQLPIHMQVPPIFPLNFISIELSTGKTAFSELSTTHFVLVLLVVGEGGTITDVINRNHNPGTTSLWRYLRIPVSGHDTRIRLEISYMDAIRSFFGYGKSPPPLLKARSKTTFILLTVAIGLFTDLFLYGLIVPVLPFLLQDRLNVPSSQIQSHVSGLLAAYAGASVLFSIPAGWIADRSSARQTPFLAGLAALLAATVLLAFGRSVGVLVLARVLQGTSAAVVWTVGLAMVLDTVGPSDLGKVIGSIFSFISVGELLAPVLGGVLYDRTGYAGVFGVGAAILGVDFLMRILVLEKKVAAKFDEDLASEATDPRYHGSREPVENGDTEDGNDEVDEETTLLRKDEASAYKIPGELPPVVRTLPILYCLRNPRLLVALLLAFVQASLLAMFDATIPTEASDLLGFNSLKSGLLFIALDIPYLVLGPVAGWAVDKYGTKPAAVVGFGYLVPVLILLRLPSSKVVDGDKATTILWCAMLSLNGVGMAIIGSPSIVEASDVVEKYDKANPGVFGENGPYAQLYGFNSLVFSAGLSIGPVLSGALRDAVGYGNMSLVFAGLSAVTTVLSFFFVGGKPKMVSRR
jgi:MFS family permease